MKTSKVIKQVSSLLLLIVLLSGCLEYTTKTKINPDGSIERIVIVKGDSSEIMKGSLPVPVDSTWMISAGYEDQPGEDSITKKIYVYKASKVFRNDEELNREIYSDSFKPGKVNRKASVEKRFRWFYTFYRYSETCFQLFPFHKRPIAEYMNEDELALIHASDDEVYYSPENDKIALKSDTVPSLALSPKDSIRYKALKESLESKYNDWMKANLYEAFYEVLEPAVIVHCQMRQTDVRKTKDSLYTFFDAHNIAESLITDDTSSVSMLKLSSLFYHTDSAGLYDSNPEGFSAFNDKLENFLPFTSDSYSNQSSLPGIIIATNSTELNGNTALWEFGSDAFFEKDYRIWVESKVLNKWAVILSGIIVVLMFAGLAIGMQRKRNNA